MYMSSPTLYLYAVSIKEGPSFNVYLQNTEIFKTWVIMPLKFLQILNKIVLSFKASNRSFLFHNIETEQDISFSS